MLDIHIIDTDSLRREMSWLLFEVYRLLTATSASFAHKVGITNASKSAIPATATSAANFHPNSFTCPSHQEHAGNTLEVGHTSWLTLIKQGDETLEDNGAYDSHFHGASRTAQTIF